MSDKVLEELLKFLEEPECEFWVEGKCEVEPGAYLAMSAELEEKLPKFIQAVKRLKTVAEFYAHPSTYFAVSFLADSPNGSIMDDFGDTELGAKPGKGARQALSGEAPWFEMD